jgi:hypothetical protein
MPLAPAPVAAPRFPVVWREGDAVSAVGELVVERELLRFEGARAGEQVEARLRFVEVRGVRVARRAPERLNGRPTIVLDRESASPFYIEPVGAGLLGEMASLLTVLREEGVRRTEHVAVIVPLRKGKEQQAASLVESGPPFELAGTGIQSHQVYVGEREAVFVFGGQDLHGVLERAIHDPALWQAGLAWRNVMAGRPRLVECSFSWSAPVEHNGG